MDLTIIPVEMTASIIKYLEPNQLLRLRKINTHLDAIAKRYGLRQRIGVDKFEISKSGKFYFNLELDEEFIKTANIRGRNKHSAMFSCKPENMLNILAEVAERTVLTTSLELFDDFPIDIGLLRVVKANKSAFKKFQNLILIDPVITLSLENMKLLMRYIPKLDSIEIQTKVSFGSFINAEVLGNRNWSFLKLSYELETPQNVLDELNDRFLCEVVSKFESFYLEDDDFDTNFTIKGVVNMMQIILSQPSQFNQNRDIQLCKVKLGGFQQQQFKPIVTALPGVTVSEEDVELLAGGEFSIVFYVLSFGENDNSTVSFRIEKPAENFRKRKASENLDDIRQNE